VKPNEEEETQQDIGGGKRTEFCDITMMSSERKINEEQETNLNIGGTGK